MTFGESLSAALAQLAAAVKALTARVVTLEARAPVVLLTQAAYDALGTKDPNTVYVIKP